MHCSPELCVRHSGGRNRNPQQEAATKGVATLKTCMYFATIWLAVLGLVAGSDCRAQELPHQGQGYLFAAPGGIVSSGASAGTLHFGGGGEGFLFKGLAVGGELGYLAPTKSFGSGVGLLSVDGSYHVGRNRRVVPFLTSGYSLAFRGGTANLVNFGGGITYWVGNRTGIRLELRDHVDPCIDCSSAHYLAPRIGLSFR